MPKQNIWWIEKDRAKKKIPALSLCGKKKCQQVLPLCQKHMLESLEVQKLDAEKGFPEKEHVSWVLKDKSLPNRERTWKGTWTIPTNQLASVQS